MKTAKLSGIFFTLILSASLTLNAGIEDIPPFKASNVDIGCTPTFSALRGSLDNVHTDYKFIAYNPRTKTDELIVDENKEIAAYQLNDTLLFFCKNPYQVVVNIQEPGVVFVPSNGKFRIGEKGIATTTCYLYVSLDDTIAMLKERLARDGIVAQGMAVTVIRTGEPQNDASVLRDIKAKWTSRHPLALRIHQLPAAQKSDAKQSVVDKKESAPSSASTVSTAASAASVSAASTAAINATVDVVRHDGTIIDITATITDKTTFADIRNQHGKGFEDCNIVVHNKDTHDDESFVIPEAEASPVSKIMKTNHRLFFCRSAYSTKLIDLSGKDRSFIFSLDDTIATMKKRLVRDGIVEPGMVVNILTNDSVNALTDETVYHQVAPSPRTTTPDEHAKFLNFTLRITQALTATSSDKKEPAPTTASAASTSSAALEDAGRKTAEANNNNCHRLAIWLKNTRLIKAIAECLHHAAYRPIEHPAFYSSDPAPHSALPAPKNDNKTD